MTNKKIFFKIIILIILFFLGYILIMSDWKRWNEEKVFLVFYSTTDNMKLPRTAKHGSVYNFYSDKYDTIQFIPENFKKISRENIDEYPILSPDSLQKVIFNNYFSSKVKFYIIDINEESETAELARAYIDNTIID